MTRAEIDIQALKERSLPHLEYMLEEAGWQTPLRKCGGEIRSACGKLSCNAETGLWCDHRNPSERKGDVIDLVATQILGLSHARGESFTQTVDWLARFLGEDATARSDFRLRRLRAREIDHRRQAKERARQSARNHFFRHVWPLRQQLEGGPGGVYVEQRGIPAARAGTMPLRVLDLFWVAGNPELKEILRPDFEAADTRPPPYLNRPCFGAILRARTGDATSIQRVILDDQGTAMRLPCGRKAKYLTGSSKGAYLRLGEKEAGPVAIVEGVEDALSVHFATGIEVWAKAGSLAQVRAEDLPLDRKIILSGDSDREDNFAARNAFIRAVETLSLRLRDVSVALPAPYGATKRDWNDLLLSGGPRMIADSISNRLPSSEWLHQNPRLPDEASGGRAR